MKLLHFQKDRYIFHLEKWEKHLLTLILRLYPVIPSAHQPVSKSAASDDKANQRLLDEALAEQRNENKKLVEALLADASRFRDTKAAARLRLSAVDVVWLLQVLNDVRVGNWILLGSPEVVDFWSLDADDRNAPYARAMELAGFFQMRLLEAVRKA